MTLQHILDPYIKKKKEVIALKFSSNILTKI